MNRQNQKKRLQLTYPLATHKNWLAPGWFRRWSLESRLPSESQAFLDAVIRTLQVHNNEVTNCSSLAVKGNRSVLYSGRSLINTDNFLCSGVLDNFHVHTWMPLFNDLHIVICQQFRVVLKKYNSASLLFWMKLNTYKIYCFAWISKGLYLFTRVIKSRKVIF